MLPLLSVHFIRLLRDSVMPSAIRTVILPPTNTVVEAQI